MESRCGRVGLGVFLALILFISLVAGADCEGSPPCDGKECADENLECVEAAGKCTCQSICTEPPKRTYIEAFYEDYKSTKNKGTLDINVFYIDDSGQVPEKKPVEGGLVIIDSGAYVKGGGYDPFGGAGANKVCRATTDSEGKILVNLPHPSGGQKITHRIIFCPYTDMTSEGGKEDLAVCARLYDNNADVYEKINWQEIPVCEGNQPDPENNMLFNGEDVKKADRIGPSETSVEAINNNPSAAATTFCWALAIVFGLLLSASYTVGRNPLMFLDMNSMRQVKMNRNFGYYFPRTQNVSVNVEAIANTIYSAAKVATAKKEKKGEGKEDGKKEEPKQREGESNEDFEGRKLGEKIAGEMGSFSMDGLLSGTFLDNKYDSAYAKSRGGIRQELLAPVLGDPAKGENVAGENLFGDSPFLRGLGRVSVRMLASGMLEGGVNLVGGAIKGGLKGGFKGAVKGMKFGKAGSYAGMRILREGYRPLVWELLKGGVMLAPASDETGADVEGPVAVGGKFEAVEKLKKTVEGREYSGKFDIAGNESIGYTVSGKIVASKKLEDTKKKLRNLKRFVPSGSYPTFSTRDNVYAIFDDKEIAKLNKMLAGEKTIITDKFGRKYLVEKNWDMYSMTTTFDITMEGTKLKSAEFTKDGRVKLELYAKTTEDGFPDLKSEVLTYNTDYALNMETGKVQLVDNLLSNPSQGEYFKTSSAGTIAFNPNTQEMITLQSGENFAVTTQTRLVLSSIFRGEWIDALQELAKPVTGTVASLLAIGKGLKGEYVLKKAERTFGKGYERFKIKKISQNKGIVVELFQNAEGEQEEGREVGTFEKGNIKFSEEYAGSFDSNRIYRVDGESIFDVTTEVNGKTTQINGTEIDGTRINIGGKELEIINKMMPDKELNVQIIVDPNKPSRATGEFEVVALIYRSGYGVEKITDGKGNKIESINANGVEYGFETGKNMEGKSDSHVLAVSQVGKVSGNVDVNAWDLVIAKPNGELYTIDGRAAKNFDEVYKSILYDVYGMSSNAEQMAMQHKMNDMLQKSNKILNDAQLSSEHEKELDNIEKGLRSQLPENVKVMDGTQLRKFVLDGRGAKLTEAQQKSLNTLIGVVHYSEFQSTDMKDLESTMYMSGFVVRKTANTQIVNSMLLEKSIRNELRQEYGTMDINELRAIAQKGTDYAKLDPYSLEPTKNEINAIKKLNALNSGIGSVLGIYNTLSSGEQKLANNIVKAEMADVAMTRHSVLMQESNLDNMVETNLRLKSGNQHLVKITKIEREAAQKAEESFDKMQEKLGRIDETLGKKVPTVFEEHKRKVGSKIRIVKVPTDYKPEIVVNQKAMDEFRNDVKAYQSQQRKFEQNMNNINVLRMAGDAIANTMTPVLSKKRKSGELRVLMKETSELALNYARPRVLEKKKAEILGKIQQNIVRINNISQQEKGIEKKKK
ncbi:MAG: hypothetical protein ABIH83_01060 [Candidatus Micrarchaeota archaeon]